MSTRDLSPAEQSEIDRAIRNAPKTYHPSVGWRATINLASFTAGWLAHRDFYSHDFPLNSDPAEPPSVQAAAEALKGIYPNEFADNFYFYRQAKRVIDAYLAGGPRERGQQILDRLDHTAEDLTTDQDDDLYDAEGQGRR
jgi:hypothetical protein